MMIKMTMMMMIMMMTTMMMAKYTYTIAFLNDEDLKI